MHAYVYLCDTYICLCMCMCIYVCSVIMRFHHSSAAVERDAAASHIMELEKELADLKTKLSKVTMITFAFLCTVYILAAQYSLDISYSHT